MKGHSNLRRGYGIRGRDIGLDVEDRSPVNEVQPRQVQHAFFDPARNNLGRAVPRFQNPASVSVLRFKSSRSSPETHGMLCRL